jgi:hypothetical protein
MRVRVLEEPAGDSGEVGMLALFGGISHTPAWTALFLKARNGEDRKPCFFCGLDMVEDPDGKFRLSARINFIARLIRCPSQPSWKQVGSMNSNGQKRFLQIGPISINEFDLLRILQSDSKKSGRSEAVCGIGGDISHCVGF